MEKKTLILELVTVEGSKTAIEKAQNICANLRGTHQMNLHYLKRFHTIGRPAEEIWTAENIRLLCLQNYSAWKKKAQQNAMQRRASIEVPPNIAELLLWFGIFVEKPNHKSVWVSNNGFNKLGRICKKLSHLDHEHQLFYLTNRSILLSKTTFASTFPAVQKFWIPERIDLFLSYRNRYIRWKKPIQGLHYQDEEMIEIQVSPALAETLLWFSWVAGKSYSGARLFFIAPVGRIVRQVFVIDFVDILTISIL